MWVVGSGGMGEMEGLGGWIEESGGREWVCWSRMGGGGVRGGGEVARGVTVWGGPGRRGEGWGRGLGE